MLVTGGSGATPADITGLGTPTLSRLWYPAGPTAGSALSNGTNTWAITQRRTVALQACTGLRVVLAAITAYEDPAGAVTESNIPGTMTVECCVFKQASNPNGGGTALDVPWGAGTTVALTDGQIAVSDPIVGLTLVQGDVVWVRTLVTVPSGGKWPRGKTGAGSGTGWDGEAQGTGTPTDLRTGTVPTTNGTNAGFHPTMCLGVLA